jgi:beta-glucosidase-like glycosyl hydrolase
VESIYQQHKYVANATAAACVAIRDGTTDVCSGSVYWTSLLNATTAGGGVPCDRSPVTDSLARTFALKFQMGLFDPVDDQPFWHVPLSALNTSASIDANRRATLSSMVLLKNAGNTLPLKAGIKLAVIGPNAASTGVLVGK